MLAMSVMFVVPGDAITLRIPNSFNKANTTWTLRSSV